MTRGQVGTMLETFRGRFNRWPIRLIKFKIRKFFSRFKFAIKWMKLYFINIWHLIKWWWERHDMRTKKKYSYTFTDKQQYCTVFIHQELLHSTIVQHSKGQSVTRCWHQCRWCFTFKKSLQTPNSNQKSSCTKFRNFKLPKSRFIGSTGNGQTDNEHEFHLFFSTNQRWELLLPENESKKSEHSQSKSYNKNVTAVTKKQTASKQWQWVQRLVDVSSLRVLPSRTNEIELITSNEQQATSDEYRSNRTTSELTN